MNTNTATLKLQAQISHLRIKKDFGVISWNEYQLITRRMVRDASISRKEVRI